MPKVFDTDIVETSSTIGPGTYTLDGPRTGYRSFDQGFNTGDTPYYVVRNAGDTKYEHNRGGIYTSGSNTLSRSVYLSSNGNAPVSWVNEDLPLLIYVPTATEILEDIVKGFRSGTRSVWLQTGMWVKSDFPSAGKDTLVYYDGSNDVALGESEAGSAYFHNLPPGQYVDMAYAVTPGAEPRGTLICDGTAISRTTYSKLFAKIGTTHGVGNGSSTFNKPDLRGRVRLGRDNQGGTAAGVIDVAYYANASVTTNGSKGGVKGHTGGVGVASVTVNVGGTISGNTYGSLRTTSAQAGTHVYASGGGGDATGWDHWHWAEGSLGVTGTFAGNGSGSGITSAFSLMQPGIIVDTLITTGGQ